MYHTLVGTTQWGEALDKLGWYGPDEFRFHPSEHPHAMVVCTVIGTSVLTKLILC